MDTTVKGLEGILPDKQDHPGFSALAKSVGCDDGIAFVGSGISARVGYADWSELLGKLRDIAIRDEPTAQNLSAALEKDSDITWRAEVYRGLLEKEKEADYFELLRTYFSPRKKPDEAIALLAGLPFGFFVTTNYDISLETALRDSNRGEIKVCDWADDAGVRTFMDSFVSREQTVSLVYLHGRYDCPQNIVLCERDYARRYVRSDETVRRLFALFSMRRVVFFGFSMTDPDIMSVLRQVNASLGHEEPRHFAILPTSEKLDADRKNTRERLASKYGVRAIYYDSRDGHVLLEDLLRELSTASGEAAARAEAGGPSGPYGNVLWRRVLARPRGVQFTSGLDFGSGGLGKTATIPPRPGPFDETRTGEGPPAVREPVPDAPSSPDPSQTPWKDSHEFNAAPVDTDDPVRGRFGGLSERNGLVLVATVTPDERSSEWFRIQLEVRPVSAGRPLVGEVEIHLHPSFSPKVIKVAAADNLVSSKHLAWGAFTVGALADYGRTPLELNLADLPSAPTKFRSR